MDFPYFAWIFLFSPDRPFSRNPVGRVRPRPWVFVRPCITEYCEHRPAAWSWLWGRNRLKSKSKPGDKPHRQAITSQQQSFFALAALLITVENDQVSRGALGTRPAPEDMLRAGCVSYVVDMRQHRDHTANP